MTIRDIASDAVAVLFAVPFVAWLCLKQIFCPWANHFEAFQSKPPSIRDPSLEGEMRKWKLVPEKSFCWWCGLKRWIQPHHSIPVNVDPKLQHDQRLWVPLCEHGKLRILLSQVKDWIGLKPDCHCHLEHGHLGSFKNFNKDIIAQCKERKAKGLVK